MLLNFNHIVKNCPSPLQNLQDMALTFIQKPYTNTEACKLSPRYSFPDQWKKLCCYTTDKLTICSNQVNLWLRWKHYVCCFWIILQRWQQKSLKWLAKKNCCAINFKKSMPHKQKVKLILKSIVCIQTSNTFKHEIAISIRWFYTQKLHNFDSHLSLICNPWWNIILFYLSFTFA